MADDPVIPSEGNDSDDDFPSQQKKQEAAAIAEREAAMAAYYSTSPSNSVSPAKSPPPVTERILRDLGRVGARGEGFRNNTPINPEQLKSEAQTRAFFRRTGQSKPSTQIDPYQLKDDPQALEEFYNPTEGALKGQHFSPPTEYSDSTLAASNEAFNAVPHRRGTMSEKSIPHINPHSPNPLTKKGYGEASTSDLDRQAKSAAWMADPKNNKGRTEFRRYQSSPAEINPAILREQRIKAAYAKNATRPLDDIYAQYGPQDGSRGGTAKAPIGIYDTQKDTEEDKFLNKDQDLPDDFIGPAYKNNGTIHHTTQKWTENLKGDENYDNGTFDKVYKQEVDNFVAKNPTYKPYLQRVGYSGFQVKEINPYNIMNQLNAGTYVGPSTPAPATPAAAEAAEAPLLPKLEAQTTPPKTSDALSRYNLSSNVGGVYRDFETNQNVRVSAQKQPHITDYYAKIAAEEEESLNKEDTNNNEKPLLPTNTVKTLKSSIWSEIINVGNEHIKSVANTTRPFLSNNDQAPEFDKKLSELARIKVWLYVNANNSSEIERHKKLEKYYNEQLLITAKRNFKFYQPYK